jgi:UPF0755 protein
MRTSLRIAKSAFILAQFLMLAGWMWLYFESRPASTAGPEMVMFDVEKGKGVRAIAESLRSKNLIRKIGPFVLGYEFFYSPQSIKAGEYELPRGGPALGVLNILVKGKIYLHPVTVAEGLTAKEIGDAFAAAGFGRSEEFRKAFTQTDDIASWDAKAKNLEGYLFPETYHLPKGISSRDIFHEMTGQFKTVFGEPWRRRAAEMRLSVRDIVTLASLIEKESSLPDEKKLVSAVFHNRLRIGMKLDCDPTIVYALKLKGPFEGRLHSKDLKLNSPYNTYLYAGLPPGPICNPGRESLEAALYPAEADYIYFVSKNDGSHHFSKTLREHRLAVKKYQQ